MAKRKKSSPKEATPDFETALQHLKEALGALESEELTLEQSLKQYEDGIRYLGHCHRALESAKQKIEQLVTIDDQGKIVTKPFDGTASDQITSTTRRSRSAKPASGKPVAKMAEDRRRSGGRGRIARSIARRGGHGRSRRRRSGRLVLKSANF